VNSIRAWSPVSRPNEFLLAMVLLMVADGVTGS
jgi:hypothetical protein